MKKLSISLAVLAVFFSTISLVSAQGMMGRYMPDSVNVNNSVSADVVNSTAKDEAEGKAILDKLQSKKIECASLKDDDFDLLGDYFMGLMSGNNHASMNMRMSQSLGEQGEKEMHIVMGKKLSGCDANAVIAPQYQRFMPWANMMGGFQNGPVGDYVRGDFMHNRTAFFGLHLVAGVTLLLVWAVLILGIIALVRSIRSSSKK